MQLLQAGSLEYVSREINQGIAHDDVKVRVYMICAISWVGDWVVVVVIAMISMTRLAHLPKKSRTTSDQDTD
jgi:hypothetical protein